MIHALILAAVVCPAPVAAQPNRFPLDVSTRAWSTDYPQYQKVGDELEQTPNLPPGTPNPGPLHRYGGEGPSYYNMFNITGTFEERKAAWSRQKPQVVEAQRKLLESRYAFTGKTHPTARMTGGRLVPVGPVARLPGGVKSWEVLSRLSAGEVKSRDIFPYLPLPHPLASTGGSIFPQRGRPELQRFDVDFDLPDAYLPEYPPPLFLTTRPDLGDVSKGRLITGANYFELLNGILTPEQLEGARLAGKPLPLEWFNDTSHRAIANNAEASCLSCHVNGHTVAAIELEGTVRPQLVRQRLDTPSWRGLYARRLYGLKRGLRVMSEFALDEDHFGGDKAGSSALLGKVLDQNAANRLESFMAVIDFPPAPKLDVYGRLDPEKATASERAGEKLFFGKARCSTCHAAPYYTDNSAHDLRVERFYKGRAEGPSRTPSLRGLKDSPPYFHDGRLPTIEDAVEFFNLVLELKLNPGEKTELADYLRAL